MDTAAIRAVHAAVEDLDAVAEVDRNVESMALNAKFRESATRSASRLLEVEAETGENPVVAGYEERVAISDRPWQYVAAFDLVTARYAIPVCEACLAHVHAFLAGLLGAGQRLRSLGHAATHRLLRNPLSVGVAVVEASAYRGMDRMEPFAPLIGARSMMHERADRRLFVS